MSRIEEHPLWWMDPPFDVVARIIRRARKSIPNGGLADSDPTLARQPWLRKVSAVVDGELRAAHIYVEGG